MAPRKRSRNNEGSSQNAAGAEEFDAGRFVNPEAQAYYFRHRTRSIAKERGFDPSHEDGELLEMIRERGWQRFCKTPMAVPMGVVREFYANASIEKNGFSFVRGTVVNYEPQTIRALFNLPPQPEGVQDWYTRSHEGLDLELIVTELCAPGSAWKYSPGTTEPVTFLAKDLNRYAQAWNLFICAKLLQSSHPHEITVERAILLWGILKEEYIDLGLLLHQSMIRFMGGVTTQGFPHASVVTMLCQGAGITWGVEEQLQEPMGPITHTTVSRLVEWQGGIAHHRGLGFVDRDDTESEEEPVVPERGQRAERRARVARASHPRAQVARASHPRAQHFMTQDQHSRLMRRMTRRIDASHNITSRRITDLAAALSRVYLDQGRQPDWPDIHTYGVYPPPDSPPEEGDDASD